MRKTLSPEAKSDLQYRICERIGQLEDNEPFVEPMMNEIEQWYNEQNTFTDVIDDDGNDRKQCPTCKKTFAARQISLNKTDMKALTWMVYNAQNGIKIAELSEKFPEIGKSRNFALLRYWQLIEKHEDFVYKPLPKAKEFVDGRLQIPRSIWIFLDEVIAPPEGKKNGKFVFIQNVDHLESVERKAFIDQSISARQLDPEEVKNRLSEKMASEGLRRNVSVGTKEQASSQIGMFGNS